MILIDFITKECWCLMTYNKMRLIVGVFVIVITILMGVFMYFLLEETGAFNTWYFLAGMLIGPLYEYWQEGRLVNIKQK